MLTRLGARHPQQRSMRELLLDCHARIRTFCALANRLAQGAPAPAAREAAGQLHRYFSVALPLHLRDEEQSVRPRLLRLDDPALSAALEAMTSEHLWADPKLAGLVDQWSVIAREATQARCAATEAACVWLEAHMSRHLRDEELRIFPALDRLLPEQWDAIAAEMQARRR